MNMSNEFATLNFKLEVPALRSGARNDPVCLITELLEWVILDKVPHGL